jgi:hypothetical protein
MIYRSDNNRKLSVQLELIHLQLSTSVLTHAHTDISHIIDDSEFR